MTDTLSPATVRSRQRRTAGLRVFGALALALILACSKPPSAEAPSAEPAFPGPILVIDLDTLRADHLGCYGYDRPTSLHIDQLASEAYRFEWAYGQAPDTAPSHSSTFTSLYPSVHGVNYNGARLPDAVTTMAEVFSSAGYLTAAFVDGGFMIPEFNLNQGFQHYAVSDWGGFYQFGQEAIDWITEHADKKFFLWIHSYDVHADYYAPEPFRSYFTDGITPTPGFEPTVRELEVIRRSHFGPEPLQLNAEDLAFTKARYDGGIRYADYWVGRILDQIRQLGLDRTATIILLSDHGEEFQEHGSVQHDRLYTTVTRIPLLIRPPGGTDGKVIDTVVQALDLMPTLLDGAGIEPPTGLQGRSLMPLLRGKALRDLPAISESPYFGHRRAVALGEYRFLAARGNDRRELFRFRQDPLEQIELSATHPDVADNLYSLLESWQDVVDRRSAGPAEMPNLDDETVEGLKALGYLD